MVPKLEGTNDVVQLNPKEFDPEKIAIWDQTDSASKCSIAVFKLFAEHKELIDKAVQASTLLRLVDRETRI